LTKYRNIKVTCDGIKFDSKKEAKRYLELKLLERGHIVSDLVLQPRMVLQKSFKDHLNKTHRKIEYVCDFSYIKDGQEIWEDVKGYKTDVYKIKMKLFVYQNPNIIFLES